MQSSIGANSLEVQPSAMTVSSSPASNRAPALSVSSLSSNTEGNGSNDGTPPQDIQHPFSNTRSHLNFVEDEENSETGSMSMRYSPPSPKVLQDFRASIPPIDIDDNVGKNLLISTHSFDNSTHSAKIKSQGQTLSRQPTLDPSRTNRNRSASYPSPIGRGIPSSFSNGNSPSNTNSPSNLIEAPLSNLFSRNSELRVADLSKNRSYINESTVNSKDNIDFCNTDLANLSLGKGKSANDYSNCFSPSTANSNINSQKQFSPGVVSSSFYSKSNSFDHHLDKSPLQASRPERDLLSAPSNASIQQVSPSPSKSRFVNLHTNHRSSNGASQSLNRSMNELDNVLPSAWDDSPLTTVDNRVKISGSNLSSSQMQGKRNGTSSLVRGRSLLDQSDDFNSQKFKNSSHDNISNVNANALYNSNKNTLQQAKQSSSPKPYSNFKTQININEGENQKNSTSHTDVVYDEINQKPKLRHSLSDGLQYASRVENVYDNIPSMGSNSFPRPFASAIQSQRVEGTRRGFHRGKSAIEIGQQHGNLSSYNSSIEFRTAVERINRNPYHGKLISNGLMEHDDMRNRNLHMRSHSIPNQQSYNDHQSFDSIQLPQQLHAKSLRPPLQQQNNLTPFHQAHNSYQNYLDSHNQISVSRLPSNVSLSQQVSSFSHQSRFSPGTGNDFNRPRQVVNEQQMMQSSFNHLSSQTGGKSHRDQHSRSPSNQDCNFRRGQTAVPFPNQGNVYLFNSTRLPPMHMMENDTVRPIMVPNKRISNDGSLSHYNMLQSSMDYPSHGSNTNFNQANSTNEARVVYDHGANHGGNIGKNLHSGHLSHQARDTIDIPHGHSRDYVDLTVPKYGRRQHQREEPIMNGNDGDPYSVGGNPLGPSRQHVSLKTAVVSNQMTNFVPLPPQQSNRNTDATIGCDVSNTMKGGPKHLNIPYGHFVKTSFDSASLEDGIVPSSQIHKMTSGIHHSQQIASMSMPVQNGVRSSQGSISSASVDNPPPIVSPYPRESQITVSSNSNTGPKLVYNIKFKRTQRSFILGPRAPPDVKIGCYVKVEADRGEDLGFVVSRIPSEKFNATGRSSYRVSTPNSSASDPACISSSIGGNNAADLKQVIRLATHDEVNHLKVKKDEEDELLKICRAKVKTRGLPMTVCDAEYQFDRNKLTFFFEADGRIDFRELVRDLFSIYKTRIWMQQLDKNNGGSTSTSSNTTSIGVGENANYKEVDN